ncbi:hypothetical protein M427DRAFT_290392 [Gonapodya prolifera JEL478]|uniref:Uncharacterized protein n=1 Tax=Gonapodya prolifera (strain JEL478) TaxID=1344416 RepID=A0A139AIN8_GONPJ|nr:hypothetical protein M427DRAFT_290392 [Gonapodya prolifera JEL478]|eukprot:KXS16414.1 hypothetical protein M427DRAFT_290392 [Gonapodya prolifera JEL478]
MESRRLKPTCHRRMFEHSFLSSPNPLPCITRWNPRFIQRTCLPPPSKDFPCTGTFHRRIAPSPHLFSCCYCFVMDLVFQ